LIYVSHIMKKGTTKKREEKAKEKKKIMSGEKSER
jgi:hypothetical protein